MKKFYLNLIFALCSVVFAAPFGFKMGMTIGEIEKHCEEKPVLVKDDIYLVKPLKKHPLFTSYFVCVNEEKGLYEIKAFSDYVSCNKYGTEIQNKFNTVKDRISKIYGNPRIIDEVDSDIYSFMQKDEYWYQTLQNGARQLSAVWGENIELSDELNTIALDCVVDNSVVNGARLILLYYFSNSISVEDEQDSVF